VVRLELDLEGGSRLRLRLVVLGAGAVQIKFVKVDLFDDELAVAARVDVRRDLNLKK